MTLVLSSFKLAHCGEVRVFANDRRALEHVRDHILTAPECQAWALVRPALSSLVDLDSPNARYRCWTQAEQSSGNSLQDVYDEYADEIARSCGEASRVGWRVELRNPEEEGSVVATFSTLGVLTIIQRWGRRSRDIVRTAYLAGQGIKSAVGEASGDDGQGGLPRERSSKRTGMRRSNPREDRKRLRLQDRWSDDERLYYTVFRPAVQFIRSSHYDGRPAAKPGDPPVHRHEYAQLKDRLPPQSQLKFAHWQELRGAPGAG